MINTKVDRVPIDLLRTHNFNLVFVQHLDHILEIQTTKSGVMVNLNEYVVYFTYSNNEDAELIMASTVTAGKITFDIPASKLADSGRYKFQIIVQKDSKTQEIARGQLLVRANDISVLGEGTAWYGGTNDIIGDEIDLATFILEAEYKQHAKEGDTFNIEIDPDPEIENVVIAYPVAIRVLHSVLDNGVESRSGWINDPNSKQLTVEGITYRVYQHVPEFAWTLPKTFNVTL